MLFRLTRWDHPRGLLVHEFHIEATVTPRFRLVDLLSVDVFSVDIEVDRVYAVRRLEDPLLKQPVRQSCRFAREEWSGVGGL